MTDWRLLHRDHFAGRNCVVTGGAGFIGSHLTAALLALGARVTVVDDLSAGRAESVPGGARLVRATVVDGAAMSAAITGGVEFVFHLAALGSVPASVERPAAYVEVNTVGTMRVLEAARAAGVKRVMFAASSSAYGDTPTLPKHESMPVMPMSPYAATKAAGEGMMRAWAHCYGVDAVSLRYFNIFGPRQSAESAYAAVIAAFAKAVLAGRRPVIFGDGSQSRDFTYVDNAVHANLLAARAGGRLGGAVLNVATGRAITIAQLAARVVGELGGGDGGIDFRPPRAGDVLHSLADLAAVRGAIGYEPLVDFETGLAATLRWYRKTAGNGGPA